ncbi:YwmB family TATA-box binding protein [Effusibacillus lacus]|uniref:TATA-box binding protein n=1 Tax=Effusibacillus lacus TaxID=1348429 RepID=A0A292YMD1_9BACL|nr:YwmB family TATA-box binding protein [Effusibacillus lacus]TCS71802.1 TATA-box binding protein [Effusibacillus lacus]GAX89630.1 hypothetical protein EFBL_1254 [Effusibacillus lacus]
MKKMVLFFLFITLLAGVAFAGELHSGARSAKKLHMGEFLNRAFAASGAQGEGYSVHNWSVVNSQYLPMDALKLMAGKINAELAIPDPQEHKNSEERQNVYQLYGQWDPHTSVSLILTSMNLSEHPQQTVLVIKIERESDRLQDIPEHIEKVKQAAAQVGATPQISTCIKGFFNDRIEGMERDQLVSGIFAAVEANEVEGIRSDSLTSVSGYSPIVLEYIMTNKKRMNLQVAVHYDEYSAKTRILVGSPIVTIEY